MKNKKTALSRRTFLSKSSTAAVAAGSSIIAIAAAAPQTVRGGDREARQMLVGDPVDTTSTQTLYNKTLNSFYNTLGTNDLNVKEFSPNGTDITDALNSAISFLANAAFGGTILIPPRQPADPWTTRGGHDLVSGIVIEGSGYRTNILGGSEIKLVTGSGAKDFVFRVKAPWQNCSLRRLTINMQSNSNAVGLLLTDHIDGVPINGGTHIYQTNVEEVFFYYGKYGIKVDSKETNNVSTNFECILNRFERVGFFQCQTGFSCNSINGGYTFDNCYFNLPTPNGTALDCKWIGNISLEHCLFVGNQTPVPNVPPSDSSTILKTFGAYNNISFYDCQDENVEFYYQNSTNHWGDVPIVFRNCIIQSIFKYTANGSVIFDSCAINVTEIKINNVPQGHVRVTDTSSAWVRVYLKGWTQLRWHFDPPVNTKFDEFVNPNSFLTYENIGGTLMHPNPLPNTSPFAYEINMARGAVEIKTGAAYVVIYNNLVTPNSLVFAQLRTFDPNGTRIREVQCNNGYIQINLTQAAAADLSVGFMLER